MQHWFVYYKLDPASARAVEPALRAMLSRLAADCGVRARLLRRADGADGAVTLLEVYEGVERPETFDGSLSSALSRAALPATLVAQRRIERFEDV
ncbi:MAG: DUF4936 family protein [Burkholderiaceae bacterium]|jgi:hypothetical protein|nr:DUF4936 family protein [Burkholderiaceae bacterium]